MWTPSHGVWQRAGSATQRLDALVRTALLPVCPSLLDDEDPIPLYTLKLLVALLEAHPALVLVRPVTRLRNKPNSLGGKA